MKSKAFSAYSDESGTFHRRYQTIALVSGQEAMLSQLRKVLKRILDRHGVDEVKSNEIGSHSRKVKAAREFLQRAVSEFVSQAKGFEPLTSSPGRCALRPMG